jgi:hypothetical protein
VIHSDHGTQYASWAFTRRALDSGLVPSMGSIGDCYDNGLMESFWARMQVELLKRKRWNTRLEFANAIFEYLEIFHNRQRRHSSLGMLSPIEYELLSSETAQIGVYFAAGAPTRSTTSVSGTAPLLAGLCSLPSLFSTGEGPRKDGVRERELSSVLELSTAYSRQPLAVVHSLVRRPRQRPVKAQRQMATHRHHRSPIRSAYFRGRPASVWKKALASRSSDLRPLTVTQLAV